MTHATADILHAAAVLLLCSGDIAVSSGEGEGRGGGRFG